MEYKDFEVPDGIEQISICADTGLLPRVGCPVTEEYFDVGTMPTEYCDQHFYEYDESQDEDMEIYDANATPTPDPEPAPDPEPTPTPDPTTPVNPTPVKPTPVKPAVEKDNNKTNDNTNKKVDTADKKTTKTEAPKTGDTANIAMNVFVMAICGAAIVTVIFRKRFTCR